ncbi:MAG: hypothetical protein HRU19_13190 [Pseudobacteriovorax sp.]|nr:hypothetical protein [Pseudobacteriovorax sp.]
MDTTLTRNSTIPEIKTLVDRLIHNAASKTKEPLCLSDKAWSRANFENYLNIRKLDLRPLQARLQSLGLSSLGRSEDTISVGMETINLWLSLLDEPMKTGWQRKMRSLETHRETSHQIYRKNAEKLLGKERPHRRTRIMATLDSCAYRDLEKIKTLIDKNVDLFRINCGHGTLSDQRKTIRAVKYIARDQNASIKIMCDLSGPKIRTSSLGQMPGVIKVKPKRDKYGRCLEKCIFRLAKNPNPLAKDDIPVKGDLQAFEKGETLTVRDARNRLRKVVIIAKDEDALTVASSRTCYLINDLTFEGPEGQLSITGISNMEVDRRYFVGDRFILSTENDEPRQDAVVANLACFWSSLKKGDPILFDDGNMRTIIRELSHHDQTVTLEVTHAPLKGFKMKGDRGVNLPHSVSSLPAITNKDRTCLEALWVDADIFSFSFVQTPHDIQDIKEIFSKKEGERGIIIKIETSQAIDHLSQIIRSALDFNAWGVMIARGDLAVEVGYSRLAELQEQIMWLTRAAHTPVIWATQVLESLAKGGIPSRGDLSDVTMAERAECIMLNQGPHIGEAISLVDDILSRMKEHQWKNTTLMRGLGIAATENTSQY